MRNHNIQIFMCLIIYVLFQFNTGFCSEGNNLLSLGNVEIRTEKDYVYARLRTPRSVNSELGIFRYSREYDKWETEAEPAESDSVLIIEGQKVEPDDFFYPKLGYRRIEVGGRVYSIESIEDKLFIKVKSGNNEKKYSSDIVFSGDSEKVFRFRYMNSSQLWFDLRVEGTVGIESEGVGYFDLARHDIVVFRKRALVPNSDVRFVVTEIAGDSECVYVGLAYCKNDRCLDHGILIKILQSDNGMSHFFTGENGLPAGAVLRIAPDIYDASLWVATSSGIARIKNEHVITYAISDSVKIECPGGYSLYGGDGYFDLPSQYCGTEGLIKDIKDCFYKIVSGEKNALYIGLEDANECCSVSSETIRVGPGKQAVFHSDKSKESKELSMLFYGIDQYDLKIIDTDDDWLLTDVSEHMWFASDAVRFSLKESNQAQIFGLK